MFGSFSEFAVSIADSYLTTIVQVATGGWHWVKTNPDQPPSWSLMHGAVTPDDIPVPPEGEWAAPPVLTGKSLILDETTEFPGLNYRARDVIWQIEWRRSYRVRINN